MEIDLRLGDCLEILRGMPDESVHCIVTSPPYFGLRAYGTHPQIWANGHDLCIEHEWQSESIKRSGGYSDKSTLAGFTSPNTKGRQMNESGVVANRDTCSTCGAWRGELGLEPTPELYVEHLTQIFREARRVLRDDGVMWLNLGDSYAGGKGQSGSRGAEFQDGRNERGESLNRGYQTLGGAKQTKPTDDRAALRSCGIKPKDRIGIPHMVAFALRADGWYWRDEIVWHKPNPMPESVKDRTTKAHEFIFLFSKSQKYFYDYAAILEPANYDGRKDTMMKGSAKYANGHAPTTPNTLHVRGHERWSRKMKGTNYGGDGSGLKTHSGSYDKETGEYLGHITDDGIPARNKRSVWTVTTRPFKDAHFATFPPDLIRPCVLAGCPRGGTVLDPFSGAGTTAVVALQEGRNAIGIELNAEYIEIARKRIADAQAQLTLWA